jgi:hypothetical protein
MNRKQNVTSALPPLWRIKRVRTGVRELSVSFNLPSEAVARTARIPGFNLAEDRQKESPSRNIEHPLVEVRRFVSLGS